MRYENDGRSRFILIQQNGVVNPLFKATPLLAAVKEAPITSLSAIVINSLSKKECEAFSNVSAFGVHTENGSFSQRTVFKFYAFSLAFSKSSVFTAEQCERKAKMECERGLSFGWR